MIHTIATVVSKLFRPTTTDPTPTGAEAVRMAVDETAFLRGRSLEAVLEEPEMRDFGGYFQSEWKIVIPFDVDQNVEAGCLIFDLPNGHQDVESDLLDLLNALNVGLDTLEEIEGMVVPVELENGNPTVMWDKLVSENTEEAEDAEEADDSE
jgi:hypothetical protein